MAIWGRKTEPESCSEAIPFPSETGAEDDEPTRSAPDLTGLPASAGQVLESLETMSRRIEDLARELNCLGYFDDGDDGPRAA